MLVEATLLEEAWAIIANASHGDWTKEGQDWSETASKWRGKYFQWLIEQKQKRADNTPTRQSFFDAMAAELEHAYSKHGKALWNRHEFASILREEFEEMWDDVKNDAPTEQLLAEVVQVAAMCLRYAETGDRTRGDHPPLQGR